MPLGSVLLDISFKALIKNDVQIGPDAEMHVPSKLSLATPLRETRAYESSKELLSPVSCQGELSLALNMELLIRALMKA